MRRGLAVALVVAVLAGACSSDGDDEADDPSEPAGTEGFVEPDSFAAHQDDYLLVATDELDPSDPVSVIAHAERALRDESFTGDAATWESFAAFREAMTAAAIEVTPAVEGFDVVYASPSQGEMTFGWTAPLTVDGEEVALHGYPRMDNPWAQVEPQATRYEITEGDATLILDFDTGTRTAG